MLRNFIIITLRSLATHKVYTLVNILGLGVGMACSILIAVYVIHELSYDTFNEKAGSIYRVAVDGKLKGRDLKIAVTAPPMAEKLVEEFPDIKSSLRIARWGAWLVSNGTISYNEDDFLFADPNFFKFFSYRLISGNPDSVLLKPRSIVLTKTAAKRYFGDEDPIGRKLRIETEEAPYTVTGLMEDVPSNSHMHFDMLGSLSTFGNHLRDVWLSHNVYTYILTDRNTAGDELNEEINTLVEKYVSPQAKELMGMAITSSKSNNDFIRYDLQPLRKIHLYSNLDVEIEQNGKALYVYTFAVIAMLILLIACLNFMNLSTATSSNRAREVVLRKVLGSERTTLIFQFLTESVLFSFLALAVALLLAELFLPHFNRYLNINLQLQVLNNLPAVSGILFFTLFLGLFAGSYPAFFISSYEPVKVLHGILNKGIQSSRVRSVFVIFQFAVSTLIIIMALIVYAQIDYMLNKELGFEKERVLVIRRPDALKERINDFRNEILKNPNIESVTNSNSIPGRNFITSSYFIEGDSSRQNYLMNQLFVSHDFREAFSLRMVEGRFFSDAIASDTMACVINEAALRELGLSSGIGIHLETPRIMKKVGRKFRIIGVVRDFHFESVDKEIEPLVISLMPGNWEGFLNVRLSSTNIDKSIKYLESAWQKYTTEYPFLYFFLDEDFDRNYRSVISTGRVLLLFSFLSIFVACLGLFGLVSYTTSQRRHEIGVRKSLGATFYQIILLLLKEIVFLVILASFFAWTIAYLFSRFWLKDFYSRISISPRYFFIASLLTLALAIFVVLYQCYSASRHDPYEAIRAE
jgi:putative ABC transport system permease protein